MMMYELPEGYALEIPCEPLPGVVCPRDSLGTLRIQENSKRNQLREPRGRNGRLVSEKKLLSRTRSSLPLYLRQ